MHVDVWQNQYNIVKYKIIIIKKIFKNVYKQNIVFSVLKYR